MQNARGLNGFVWNHNYWESRNNIKYHVEFLG